MLEVIFCDQRYGMLGFVCPGTGIGVVSVEVEFVIADVSLLL